VPPVEQYEDPFGETRQQALQGLATMATVGEAAARWAAVGIQNKAAERERQAQQDRAAEAAQQEADKLAAQVRAEREKMAASLDGDWLVNKASFAEAAAVWRTATVHAAADDPLAQRAAHFAEQRLRKIRPDLMDAYDAHRAAGMPVADAMRAATRDVWEADARRAGAPPAAHAQGNTPDRPRIRQNGPALPAGGEILNDLDAAVRAEAMRIATHVRPESLDELQRRWRDTGRLPPGDPVGLLRAAAVELREAAVAGGLDGHTVEAFRIPADGIDRAVVTELAARAAAERGDATQAAGVLDNPRTPVDEHTTALVSSYVAGAKAEHDAAGGAGRSTGPAPVWAQAFPRLRVGQLNPDVAAKQPAQVIAPTRGRGR
jgi:hypothetical protein